MPGTNRTCAVARSRLQAPSIGCHALLGVCLFAPIVVSGQTLPQEYGNLIRADGSVGALDTSLLGDRIDYYTGHVDFVATDISVPGNNALPVAVGRRYSVTANPSGAIPERAFGDWDIDVPHLEGIVATDVGWTVPGSSPNARCSSFSGAPPAVVTSSSLNQAGQPITTSVDWEQYSTGYSLSVPGYGRRELLSRASGNHQHPTSGSYPIVTNDWWMVSCLSYLDVDSPGDGEGFLAIAPDGTKYTFNWLAERPYVPLTRPADTDEPDITAIVDRSDMRMMATKVEDRFGNWVRYRYDPYHPLRLQQITSSDGRAISITYVGTTNTIRTISDGSHSWTYGYTAGSLSSVTLPDGSHWTIDFSDLGDIDWSYSQPWSCGTLGTPTNGATFTGTITHPSGARGEFTFDILRHGRSGVPTGCYENSAGVAFARIQPAVYDSVSLVDKQITGPHIAPLNWSFSYSACSNNCSATSVTTVNDPRGYNTRYTFGTVYNDDEGLLKKKESGGSGAYLQTENYTYFAASGQSYPTELGTPTQSRGDTARLAQRRPLKQRSMTLQGASFIYTAGSLDEFGFPTTIVRDGSDTRTDILTVVNNKSKWILGTVKKISSSAGTELDMALDSNNQPTSIRRFGSLDETLSYNGDGTLALRTDGNGHSTSYSSWYRGVPQHIGYSAPGEGASASVTGDGRISSWTDERGSTTTYGHDAMGRLTSIHYPSGDPGAGTSQTFDQTTIGWSTSASGWSSSETTGTYHKTTSYDALLRPVLINENGSRFVRITYDGDGGPSFVSLPSANSSEASGTTFEHDGLGRVTSENFAGHVTSYSYGSGFTTSITDASGTTSYTFKTFDEPTTAWPTTITNPFATTIVSRDAWGRPHGVRRGSVERTWSWGGRFVCASYSPERGTTVLKRDGVGNITQSAVVSTSDVGCDDGAINASNKVARTYDGRNRLLTVDYPGGADQDITQAWWPNNRLRTARRGAITREWNYNRRGLLTFERLSADGQTYQVDTDYNSRGQPSALTYPDGSSIDYAPNAWGEPTKVGAFATNIAYWPNGAVKGLTYGNGIVRSMTQEERRLPEHVQDGSVLNLDFDYDGAGNLTRITDNRTGHPDSVTMTYDDANRLKTANASALWGNATFTYDDFDNLKTSTVGGVQTSFTINATTNRATAMVTGGVSTPLQYDNQGHLTQKGAQSYTFDRSDLLLGIPGVASYRYDAEGRRTVTDGSGYERIAFYDQQGRLLYEIEPGLAPGCNPASERVFCSSFEEPADDIAGTRYVYLGRHLVGKDGPDGRRYLHTDVLGSLVAETDEDRAVTQRYHYEPYGRPFGGAVNGPGFTGHVMDSSGLVYMQARYYDPELARFLSTDPVDPDPQTGVNFSRYAYADNNPYSKYDPNGREAACISLNVDCVGDSPAQHERDVVFAKSAADFLEWSDREIFAPLGPFGQPEHVGTTAAIGALRSAASRGSSLAVEGAAAAKGASKQISKERQALVDMARADKRRGITPDDMQAYKDLNKELPDPLRTDLVRGPETHPGSSPQSQRPHGHVGPVDHIPIVEPEL